jgi:hypothetical protein
VNHKQTTSSIPLRVVLFGLIMAVPAHAYVDPNAQSLLAQLMTPLLVIAVTGLTFLRREASSAIGRFTTLFQRRK